MRLAIESDCDSFNLMHGFGYYKARWLADMHDTHSLQIYRVGTPFYWRRLLGDLQRRWSSKDHGDAAALFNPARREVGRADPVATETPQIAAAERQEHAYYASLIAAVRRGRGGVGGGGAGAGAGGCAPLPGVRDGGGEERRVRSHDVPARRRRVRARVLLALPRALRRQRRHTGRRQPRSRRHLPVPHVRAARRHHGEATSGQPAGPAGRHSTQQHYPPRLPAWPAEAGEGGDGDYVLDRGNRLSVRTNCVKSAPGVTA